MTDSNDGLVSLLRNREHDPLCVEAADRIEALERDLQQKWDRESQRLRNLSDKLINAESALAAAEAQNKELRIQSAPVLLATKVALNPAAAWPFPTDSK